MLIILLLILILLYLYSIAPNHFRGERMRPFEQTYIAHRGFFDNATDAPENSLAAFQRAVDAGFGIELDVQMTSDHKLVVFHDESLKRMCHADAILHKCTYEELQRYHLADSEQKIPLLEDVLQLVDGRVPLVVEIKHEGDWRTTTRLTAKMLDSYKGTYCVESFHPLILAWFRKKRSDVIRGQLSTNHFKEKTEENAIGKFIVTNLMLNFLSKPDFIAYNHKYKKQFSYRVCRKLFKVTNACWTIRSEEQLEDALKEFTVIIFDGFDPRV